MSPYEVLKIKSFRYFVAMRFLLTIGIWMQELVCAWKVYDITHDPLALGLVGLAEAVPAVGFSLFAGYIADRYSKNKVLFIAILGFLLSAIIMLGGGLALSHGYKFNFVYLVYGVTFFIGIIRAFYAPAAFSLMGMIVPKPLYPYSSTWNSTSWQAASILGPVMGGFLYAFYDFNGALIAVLAVIIAALVMCLNIQKVPKMFQDATETISSRLQSGLKFVFSTPILLSALTLDLVCVFFGGATALLPVFAKDILHLGPQGLGLLRAAPAVGAVLMLIYSAYFPFIFNVWKKLLIAIAVFGASMLVFGLSTNLYLSLAVLFISGAADAVSIVIRSLILQTFTPDNMRGRVAAVNTMFIGSSNEIGAFESGATAKIFGTALSVSLGASVTLGVVGLTWLRSKSLFLVNISEKK